ncbi:MAG: FIST C-terminal domain-containing protein [Chloroflexi bacterium]|nr:FIST C-terminal domain-containing protein [Chloroflexota bacterium]
MYALAAMADMYHDSDEALTHVLGDTGALWDQHEIDLALFFASPHFAPHYSEMLQQVRAVTGARLLLGCSGQGIIGKTREAEGIPAVSLLVASLPGADLRPVRITQPLLAELDTPEAWHAWTGADPDATNAWMLFADPFRLDCEALLEALSAAYPGVPVVGGLASSAPTAQRTQVFLHDRAYGDGAVAVAIGRALTIRAVVAQGSTPIGEPWTITGAEGNVITSIGGRPAYELLVDTLQGLPEELRQRARRNLLVGLAMNEYRDTFRRGDFLIRNLVGADPRTGALAVGALPRVGQTLQFQIRDAQAADDDLREHLAAARAELGEQRPVAALLCSCNGRGIGLFGSAHHDAGAVAEHLGPMPLAGFFCNGEIGPVGDRNFLHGYTASLALLVPSAPPPVSSRQQSAAREPDRGIL